MNLKKLVSTVMAAGLMASAVACGAAPDGGAPQGQGQSATNAPAAPAAETKETKEALEASGVHEDYIITKCPPGQHLCRSVGGNNCQDIGVDCPVCFYVNGHLECY